MITAGDSEPRLISPAELGRLSKTESPGPPRRDGAHSFCGNVRAKTRKKKVGREETSRVRPTFKATVRGDVASNENDGAATA